MSDSANKVTKKPRRKWRRWLLGSTALLLLLVALLAVPGVQRKISVVFLNQLSARFGAEFSLDRMQLSFLDRLTIDGLLVKDQKQDTLLYVHRLEANIDKLNWSKGEYALDEVTLIEPYLKTYVQADSAWNFQFFLDSLSSGDTSSAEFNLLIEQIVMQDLMFRRHGHKADSITGFDHNYFDLQVISLEVDDFVANAENVDFTVDHLAGHDFSGGILKQVSAQYQQSPGQIIIDVAALDVNNSQLQGFVKIKGDAIDVKLSDSKLYGPDLVYYSGLDDLQPFEGMVRGVVLLREDSTIIKRGLVKADGLKVDMKGYAVRTDQDPIHQMDMNIEQLKVDQGWIAHLVGISGDTSYANQLSMLEHLGYKGRVQKNALEIASNGHLVTNLGIVTHKVEYVHDSIPYYAGIVHGRALELGIITGDPKLGMANVDFDIEGDGVDVENLDVVIDGQITSIRYDQHTFRHIDLNGDFKQHNFKGEVISRDSLLNFDFDGSLSWENQAIAITSVATLNHVDASPFKVLLGDSVGYLAGSVEADIKGKSFETLQGTVKARSVELALGDRQLKVRAIDFEANRVGDQRLVTIQSDYLNGRIAGAFHTDQLLNSLQASAQAIVPAFVHGDAKSAGGISVKYELNSRNFTPVAQWWNPKLQVPAFSLQGSYNGQGQADFDLRTEGIGHGQFFLDDIELKGGMANDTANFDLSVGKLMKDTTFLAAFNFKSSLSNNALATRIQWDDFDTTSRYNGELNAMVGLVNDQHFDIIVPSAKFVMADSVWDITDTLKLSLDSGRASIDQFELHTMQQVVSLRGEYGQEQSPGLHLQFEHVQLGNIGHLLSDSLQLHGVLDGSVNVKVEDQDLHLLSDVNLREFEINETSIGGIDLDADWNTEQKAINLSSTIIDSIGQQLLKVDGQVYTADPLKDMDLEAKIEQLPMSWLNLLPSEGVSNFDGVLDGQLKVRGKFSAPVVNGDAQVKQLSLKVNELNTTYSIPVAQLAVTEDIVRLRPADLVDEMGNKSKIKGDVRHNAFNDIRYRINVQANQLMALNTGWSQGASYYGTAIVSGEINMRGTPTELIIEGDAKTLKGTRLFMPLGDPDEVTEHDFITFKQPDQGQIVKVEEQEAPFQFSLMLNAEITTDAEIQMIFNQAVGDIIRTTGTGDIRLDMRPGGDFKMYGEYVITDGDYLFNLENLLNKKFIVDAGSTINWDGNPEEAVINMLAIYKLRSSLADIMPAADEETMANYAKRIPIECYLRTKDDLYNPTISFQIVLPSVDQETRDVFNSLVNDENEVNKQVFALLLLQRFIPTGEGGARNAFSGAGGRSASEMLSNQVSNWLSQISEDVDIGINYRPGDQPSTNEFELAMSTQLFNDRITVDGNLGNQTSVANTDNTSDIVGDFNIEYKVSKDGRFRAKVYNQSNDYNLAAVNTGKYTQGAGLFYRVEFEKLFGRRKKAKQD